MKIKLSDLLMALDLVSDDTEVLYDPETEKIHTIFDGIGSTDLDNLDSEEREDIFDRCIPFPDRREINEYGMIEDFIDNLPDGKKKEQLARAISGRGAFRRFKDKAAEVGLADDWYNWRDASYEQAAREWAEKRGIEVIEDAPSKLKYLEEIPDTDEEEDMEEAEKAGRKRILIVVDMQNDFIDGSLGTREAVAIVPKVVGKIKSYPREDVYATMDTHPKNYLETQEGRNLPVKHCIRGTKGWKIRKEIADLLLKDHIVEKPTFGSVVLATGMRALAGDDPSGAGLAIELVGLCTDICVVSNALLLKAYLPEALISVDPSCCAGVTPEKHRAALETMKSCQIGGIE